MRKWETMVKRYFEDLKEGERLDCREIVFTKEEIIDFAKRFDPHPFHVDEDGGNRSIFGCIIASSLHTISACTRVIVDALDGVTILTGLGIDEVRLFHPVLPGDILSVDARWNDLRRSRSKPDRGIAGLTCIVTNQKGETVAEYGYRYMVACREPL